MFLSSFSPRSVNPSFEPVTHLPIGVLGKTDAARISDALKARGDVDAVAHQVAVALLDHIAEMDADAELDAALGRKTSVALDHAVLHLDGAAHGIDHAANSMMLPSPVRFTTRPLWTLMVGAIRSLQSVRSRASVPSSSLPVRRLKPTTSAARMAASFRFSVTGGVTPAFAVAEEAYCTPRGVAKSPRAVRPQQDVLSSHVGDLGFSICHVRCAFTVGHSLAIIL